MNHCSSSCYFSGQSDSLATHASILSRQTIRHHTDRTWRWATDSTVATCVHRVTITERTSRRVVAPCRPAHGSASPAALSQAGRGDARRRQHGCWASDARLTCQRRRPTSAPDWSCHMSQQRASTMTP